MVVVGGIMSSSIMTIDLEVENHPYYGSKASPYCPDNYVVHSAYRIDRTQDDGTDRKSVV